MTPPRKRTAATATQLPMAPSTGLGGAVDRAQRLRLATSNEHKKAWGQYFTPPEIAAFMASLPSLDFSGRVRILDPGAGTGSLGLALARALLEQPRVDQVELYCVESEPQAHRELESTLSDAEASLGRRFRATAFQQDFLEFATPRLGASSIPPVDLVISNPPYFKLSPKDDRGGDAPNIYARFMEIAAKLLRDGGQLCFIIPRSYASGPYFRRFRRRFHHVMRLNFVHVFESRNAAFKTDNVLQENIVVLYTKQQPAPSNTITISVSEGTADLAQRRTFDCRRHELVSDDENAVVSLPTAPAQFELMKRIRALPNTLGDLGLLISTGPVVPFRATDLLVDADCKEPSAPLLWLQHVRRGCLTWPLGQGFRKHEHILLSADAKLLVPVANYVILRRFSAKEEQRRLTAAALLASDWSADHIGLENHLNYIHRPGTGLTANEARGLTALLNSQILDVFFRVASGNTQVSATEIRTLPLPSLEFIERLGRLSGAKSNAEQLIERMIEDLVYDTSG